MTSCVLINLALLIFTSATRSNRKISRSITCRLLEGFCPSDPGRLRTPCRSFAKRWARRQNLNADLMMQVDFVEQFVKFGEVADRLNCHFPAPFGPVTTI
jgi:hypothetical protein